MEDDRETELQNRAYSIWEREGRPDGAHDDHWAAAEREIEGRQNGEEQADALTVEGDDIANPRALKEAARQHTDAYIVASDLEDDDQRTSSAGTREQP